MTITNWNEWQLNGDALQRFQILRTNHIRAAGGWRERRWRTCPGKVRRSPAWRTLSQISLSHSARASCLQPSLSRFFPKQSAFGLQTSHGESAARAAVGRNDALLGGYLSIQLFEHTLAPHFHFGAETHPESFMKPSAAYTAVGGLWIHTFFDGVSIASAFLVNFRVGILVFIAILLHKMPEGFTVASIMLASGSFNYRRL